jgi:hypothetical protein
VISRDIHVITSGVSCVDASLPRGPGKLFDCKCILLYWTGDYPAQASVSGTHSKTCHWCAFKSSPAPECTRRAWGSYRRYLPQGHPFRRASARFGPVENRPSPEPRTHNDFVQQGQANQRHDVRFRRGEPGVWKKDYPYKAGGCSCKRYAIITLRFKHHVIFT